MWEGRLEVCYNGRWGTVGADDWTNNNSDVVCEALGYGRSGVPIFVFSCIAARLAVYSAT